jgi:phosphatidylserine/phosphatidylglycerophosphate/cardiolipin synthase-like enzyme
MFFTNSRNTPLNAPRLSLRKSAIVLKSGFKVRNSQMTSILRWRTKVFEDLVDTAGVEIRVKQDHGAAMHLKSYQIDGRLLRTGSANFSASGEKRQDNDVVVIDNPDAAAIFLA